MFGPFVELPQTVQPDGQFAMLLPVQVWRRGFVSLPAGVSAVVFGVVGAGQRDEGGSGAMPTLGIEPAIVAPISHLLTATAPYRCWKQ